MDDYSNIFPLGRRELLKWAGLAAAGSLVSLRPAARGLRTGPVEAGGHGAQRHHDRDERRHLADGLLGPERDQDDAEGSRSAAHLERLLSVEDALPEADRLGSDQPLQLRPLDARPRADSPDRPVPGADRPLDQPGGREGDPGLRQRRRLRARVAAAGDRHLPDLHEHQPVAQLDRAHRGGIPAQPVHRRGSRHVVCLQRLRRRRRRGAGADRATLAGAPAAHGHRERQRRHARQQRVSPYRGLLQVRLSASSPTRAGRRCFRSSDAERDRYGREPAG